VKTVRESHYWVLSLAAAVLMVVLLGIHMVMMHLESILAMFGLEVGEVRNYMSVMARAGSTFWTVFYLIFLAVALYHGLYGVRSILLEVSNRKGVERMINSFVVVVGLVAFVYGTYVLLQSFKMGRM
jgi:succinate dehydrogenase / fumarate reductase membrane anchor subunit